MDFVLKDMQNMFYIDHNHADQLEKAMKIIQINKKPIIKKRVARE
jgi:hypothetical protein